MASGVALKNGRVEHYYDERVERLFRHACDSIELGVQDFCVSEFDERRIMSAVRNIDAGLELLCKVEIASTGYGRIVTHKRNGCEKTIGFNEIRDAAKHRGIGIEELRQLHEYRNDVEHLYPKDRHVAKERIARTFAWMFRFFREHLLKDPQREFSTATWAFLLGEKEILDHEIREMENVFSEMDLPHYALSQLAPYHFICSTCRSTIVFPVEGDARSFVCRKCGQKIGYGEFVENICKNCICSFCGNAIEDPGELEVFDRTGMCGHCEHTLGKDD